MLKKILIDADAIVSMKNSRDNGHKWAREVIEELKKEDELVVYLSSFAYGEALTVVSMQLGLEEAIGVDRVIKEEGWVVVDIDRELRGKGLEWFKKQTSKNSRFTDCVNMVLMEEKGIGEVFSRDEHYKGNGFVRLGVDDN